MQDGWVTAFSFSCHPARPREWVGGRGVDSLLLGCGSSTALAHATMLPAALNGRPALWPASAVALRACAALLHAMRLAEALR